MADRHRDDITVKEKEKEKGLLKGTVAATVAGCPILIQTGPNVKVLAQVKISLIYVFIFFV